MAAKKRKIMTDEGPHKLTRAGEKPETPVERPPQPGWLRLAEYACVGVCGLIFAGAVLLAALAIIR